MMKCRLYYIDVLKGLAILMVIMGHLEVYVFGFTPSELVWNIIYSCHIPLFMFLSGYVLAKTPDLYKVLKRTFAYLCPAIVIGVLFCWFNGNKFIDFFTGEYKGGYWFLFVLALFNWLLYLIGKCSDKLSFKYFEIVLGGRIWLIINILCFILRDSGAKMTSLSLCSLYYPYFIGGYLLRKYKILEKTATHHDIIMIVCLVVYVLLMSMASKGLYFPFQGMIKAFMAIGVLLLLTVNMDFSSNEKNLRMVSLGTWTLDIYIFHYFFLISLRDKVTDEGFVDWFNGLHSPFIQTFLCIVLSLFIALLCHFVGVVIRKSKLLNKIIYGHF